MGENYEGPSTRRYSFFLGRAFVEEALKRGNEITLFNRGTNKEAFPEVEQLTGDRDGDISQFENRKWDIVMDTCGFAPHQIKKIAAVLGKKDAKFVWVEEQFVLDHKIQPWTEMPLWIPEHFPLEGETEPWNGSFSINIEKALNAGLTLRPLEDTIQDVYQWEKIR